MVWCSLVVFAVEAWLACWCQPMSACCHERASQWGCACMFWRQQPVSVRLVQEFTGCWAQAEIGTYILQALYMSHLQFAGVHDACAGGGHRHSCSRATAGREGQSRCQGSCQKGQKAESQDPEAASLCRCHAMNLRDVSLRAVSLRAVSLRAVSL